MAHYPKTYTNNLKKELGNKQHDKLLNNYTYIIIFDFFMNNFLLVLVDE